MEKLEQTIQKDIHMIIDELKKCKSPKNYYDLTEKLYYLEQLVQTIDLNIDFPQEFDYELSKKDVDSVTKAYDIDVIQRINEYLSYNKKFTKMYNIINERYVNLEDVTLKYIPFNVSIEYANRFLSEFDPEIYKHFMELISSPRFILSSTNMEYDGYVLMNNYLVDSYTIICVSNILSDFISIIHETMHSYNFSLIKNASFNEHNLINYNSLIEVPAYFIELVGMDFLERNQIFTDEVKKLRMLYDSELIEFLFKFKQLIDEGSADIDEFLRCERYAYGTVLAYHFYNNYLKDKEETIKNLKQFMVDYKNYEKGYMLNNYGLNPNDIINSQKITKHIDKHLMRVM